jgi:hypothetical protein
VPTIRNSSEEAHQQSVRGISAPDGRPAAMEQIVTSVSSAEVNRAHYHEKGNGGTISSLMEQIVPSDLETFFERLFLTDAVFFDFAQQGLAGDA